MSAEGANLLHVHAGKMMMVDWHPKPLSKNRPGTLLPTQLGVTARGH